MIRTLVVIFILGVSAPALAQQSIDADPRRLTAILQQMKAQKDNATDMVAILSADLAAANAKIEKLTKDNEIEKAAPKGKAQND